MKIEIEINDDRVRYLLLSAYTASSYWCRVEFGAQGAPRAHDKYTNQEFVLNTTAIERGLSRMAVEAPNALAMILSGRQDGPCADIFMQCATHGGIVYQ